MFLLFAVASAAAPNLPIAWGFASSAYQIEGAFNVSGKGKFNLFIYISGLSVWDKWFQTGYSLLSADNLPRAPGDPFITADHYNRMVRIDFLS